MRKWADFLHEELAASDEEAIAYLKEAMLDEDPRTILGAIRHVAEARGGMTKLAADTGLSRESLYRMLSESGNPTLTSLRAVADALGLQITFEPKVRPTESIKPRVNKKDGVSSPALC